MKRISVANGVIGKSRKSPTLRRYLKKILLYGGKKI